MTTQYYRCNKCLVGRTGDVLGAPCRTQGCSGVIEREPMFSELVDDLPEGHLCPRRSESPIGAKILRVIIPKLDRWQKFKTNGQRVCSYCGSLHPDDFWRLVEQAANAPADSDYRATVSIEPSYKGYKIYVHQPGVRNAHEGGIKFYKQHLTGVTNEQEKLYRKALFASGQRFQQHLTNTALGSADAKIIGIGTLHK